MPDHCYFHRVLLTHPEWEKGVVHGYVLHSDNTVKVIVSVDYDASVLQVPLEQVSLSATEPKLIAEKNAKAKADAEAEALAEAEAKAAKEAKAEAKAAAHGHGHY